MRLRIEGREKIQNGWTQSRLHSWAGGVSVHARADTLVGDPRAKTGDWASLRGRIDAVLATRPHKSFDLSLTIERR